MTQSTIASTTAVVTARDNNGWRARSELPLNLGGDRQHLVRVTTARSPGTKSLITRASVHEVVGNAVRHVLFQDYSSQLLCSTPARVTLDVVQRQQHQALQAQDTWLDAIRAFYAAKVHQTEGQTPAATCAGGLDVPA